MTAAAATLWTVYWVGTGSAALMAPGSDLSFHSKDTCISWLEKSLRDGIGVLGTAECRPRKGIE
jgi:hypothetical protein